MSDLNCPYCDAELEVCHDDGFGYEEGQAHEMDCGECGKTFVFQTSISYFYDPEKADCLNGEDHPFSEWKKRWEDGGKRLEQRRCGTCDEVEQRTLDIPTQEQGDE